MLTSSDEEDLVARTTRLASWGHHDKVSMRVQAVQAAAAEAVAESAQKVAECEARVAECEAAATREKEAATREKEAATKERLQQRDVIQGLEQKLLAQTQSPEDRLAEIIRICRGDKTGGNELLLYELEKCVAKTKQLDAKTKQLEAQLGMRSSSASRSSRSNRQ